MFCSQCGKKIVRNDGHTVSPIDSIASSVDLKKVQVNVSVVISWLKNLDIKKCLYGVIISAVLIIIFGSMTVSALNPVKEVEGKITWAGDIYTNDSGGNIWEKDYYQSVLAAYKGDEWSGSAKVLRYDSGYSVGDSITLYIVDGKLTRDEDVAKVNVVKVGISIILLLCSVASCGWFVLSYFKHKKRG